jgi:hypothetical protein
MKVHIPVFQFLLFLSALFTFTNTLALNVSPSSAVVNQGKTINVAVSNSSGTVSAVSSNTSIANVSYTSGIAKVTGVKAGSANITVKDRRTSKRVSVTVSKAAQTLSFGTAPSIVVGGTGTVSATATSGLTPTFTSKTLSICTVSGSTVTGVAAGTCTIATDQAGNASFNAAAQVTQNITVRALSLTALPSSVTLNVGAKSTIQISNPSGAVAVVSSKLSVATVSYAANTNIATVTGVAAGSATLTVKDSKTTLTVPVSVQASTPPPVAGNYTLLAWNDLGMHCMDGMDFSVFTILPPYNTLHAQLKDKSGALISTNVKLTYEAVADSTGSINTYSDTKTNFWDWVGPLFGLNPAKDVGVNLDGLATGTPAPGNMTPSNIPALMAYNAGYKWFEAEGIPMTPFPDNPQLDVNGNKIKDFYPTVKVVAKDLSGNVLATTTTVLPVSDEMTCKGCHASTTLTNPARIAAKPVAGWVNDLNPDKDWKRNILRLHDEKQFALDITRNPKIYQNALSAKGYLSGGLLATADSHHPVLCVACHASNAYFDKLNKKTVMPGIAGIRAFTQVLHTLHGTVKDPVTQLALDTSGDRAACYNCHPGSVTQCLRGAMSNAVDSSGKLLSCQSCHGNLSAVGSSARQGWFNEPTCESCHNSAATGKRATSGVDINGLPIVPTDHTFATNANTPVAGLNLYRFSTGHGGLQCEACHGATHAEYPSNHVDDNIQSLAIQGHAGPVAECTSCHSKVPTTVNGGPHGMHTTGNAWVESHQDANKNGTATTPSCAYCHGTTSAGTPLSAIKVAKTINAGDFGTKNWPTGYQVSCFSCHNGPNPQ